MHRVQWGVGWVALGLVACGASVPPPRAAESSSAAAVSSARQAGAARDPRALRHLDLAEEQLENARVLMRDGDNRVAALVLARAKAEADVAASLARESLRENEKPTKPTAVGGGPREVEVAESDEVRVAENVGDSLAPADREKAARAALDKIAIMAVGSVRFDERGTVVCMPVSSLFDGDATQLSPAGEEKLALVVEALRHADGHAIVIEGYTSSHGDAAANRSLAKRRADAVRDHLVARGVPTERIRAEGIGAARPIADNDTVRGRMRNHRIEIVVQPVVEK